MQFDIQQLVLLALLSTALHWLFARSEIMRWAWSAATGWLDNLLRCAACSGFWIGVGLTGTRYVHVVSDAPAVVVVFTTGLLSMVTTPLVEALLIRALAATAVEDEEVPPPEPPPSV